MTWAIAWALLKRFWWTIPIAGFAIAWLIAASDARHYHKLSDQNAASAQLANSKLAISNASIDTLTNALNAMNADADARAKAYADSKAQDAATIADLDKRYAGTKPVRDALAAIVAMPGGNGACKVPSALSAALKEL